MAPAFIFAEDIAKALRDGKKEFVVAEDARISAAAMDLIREKNVRIIYSDQTGSVASEQKAPGTASEKITTGPESRGETEHDAPASHEGVFSEEEVEIIVNRVINRFRELKGEKPVRSGKSEVVPEDDDDLVICRCEEITKGEIKQAIRNGMRTLNGIKRITRAGMGLCQGQTCQRLVSQILASELGIPLSEVTPTTARAPVRPLKLSAFATG